jgi:hypothetical protein
MEYAGCELRESSQEQTWTNQLWRSDEGAAGLPQQARVARAMLDEEHEDFNTK